MSISAGPTFLRPIRSGSDCSAVRTGAPSGVAPQSTTWTKSLRNGRTVPNRPTSMDRHVSSASESSGGVSSNSAAIAAASSCRGHDRLDLLPHRLEALDLGPGYLPGVGVDQLARGVEDDLERGRQLRRCPLDPRQRLHLLLGRLPLGLGQQLRRDQHPQKVERVVDGPGRQVDGRGQQRCQPPGIAVPTQERRLSVHAVPGQLRQPPRRDRRHVQLAHAEAGNLFRALERPLHLRSGHAYRAAAQPVQLRDPLARRHHQQRVQHRPLPGVQQPVQRVPQPLVRRLANRGHQPRQRCHPGQQHPPLAQPPGRRVEQRLRALPGRPGPRVHPDPKLGLRGELAVLQDAAQLAYVLQPGVLPFAVRLQHRQIADVELLSEVVHDRRRHVRRVIQEHPEVARSRELGGIAQAVVGPTLGLDQRPVRVVQVEKSAPAPCGTAPRDTPRTRQPAHPSKTRPAPRTSKQSINTTAEGSAPTEAQVKALVEVARA